MRVQILQFLNQSGRKRMTTTRSVNDTMALTIPPWKTCLMSTNGDGGDTFLVQDFPFKSIYFRSLYYTAVAWFNQASCDVH